ncbi:MAG: hypothetical protein CVT49_06680 [candidate division Zixibacteria bacterium HGW-Zixibacteria-1]|nr:MAG: hypothetical protein CVT49_06680 [candidate division Zixibacteria bacterium HGW-Zixibacteria-1]
MMERLRTRWIIFSGLAIVVIAAYLVTVRFKTVPSPATLKAYEYIETLPESSIVIFSFDHEASSLPEIQPIALALLRHAFKNNIKIVGLSLFAEGTAIGYNLMNKTAGEYGKVYGRDYVFLGFKPQYISAILGMGESIKRVFPEDYLGNAVDTLPLMNNVDKYDKIAMIVSIADGDRTVQWVEYAGARYNQAVMAGLTAAMITSYDPYLSSEQLYAVVGGLRGAAEYENLLDQRGGGTRGMLAQSAAHLYIIVLVVIGNVVYFRGRRKRGGA